MNIHNNFKACLASVTKALGEAEVGVTVKSRYLGNCSVVVLFKGPKLPFANDPVSWMGQFDPKSPLKKVAASKQFVIYHRDKFLEDFDHKSDASILKAVGSMLQLPMKRSAKVLAPIGSSEGSSAAKSSKVSLGLKRAKNAARLDTDLDVCEEMILQTKQEMMVQVIHECVSGAINEQTRLEKALESVRFSIAKEMAAQLVDEQLEMCIEVHSSSATALKPSILESELEGAVDLTNASFSPFECAFSPESTNALESGSCTPSLAYPRNLSNVFQEVYNSQVEPQSHVQFPNGYENPARAHSFTQPVAQVDESRKSCGSDIHVNNEVSPAAEAHSSYLLGVHSTSPAFQSHYYQPRVFGRERYASQDFMSPPQYPPAFQPHYQPTPVNNPYWYGTPEPGYAARHSQHFVPNSQSTSPFVCTPSPVVHAQMQQNTFSIPQSTVDVRGYFRKHGWVKKWGTPKKETLPKGKSGKQRKQNVPRIDDTSIEFKNDKPCVLARKYGGVCIAMEQQNKTMMTGLICKHCKVYLHEECSTMYHCFHAEEKLDVAAFNKAKSTCA